MARPTKLLLPLTLTILLAAAFAPPAGAEVTVSFGVFFDGLAPYGAWTDHPRSGWSGRRTSRRGGGRTATGAGLSRPTRAGPGSATSPGPGRRTTTATGCYDPVAGWLWVPGYDEWAPAVVDWRVTDDWIGWAPRPPAPAGSSGPRLLPAHYTFVERRFFAEPLLPRYIVPVARNVEFLSFARAGPRRRRRLGRARRPGRIERVRLRDLKKASAAGRGRSELRAASRGRDRVVVEPREHGRPRAKAAKAHRVDRGPKIERSDAAPRPRDPGRAAGAEPRCPRGSGAAARRRAGSARVTTSGARPSSGRRRATPASSGRRGGREAGAGEAATNSTAGRSASASTARSAAVTIAAAAGRAAAGRRTAASPEARRGG